MESSSLPDHHVPELIVDKILRFLPTKLAVQTCFLSKEWQSLSSSFRSFDFDEQNYFELHGSPPPVDDHKHLHEKFLAFLRGHLAYFRKNSQKEPLEKLSIRLRVYFDSDEEYYSISRWLKYACRYRRLKELEVCADFYIDSFSSTVIEHLVESHRPLESKFFKKFHIIPLDAIFGNGGCLASLKLGCVKFAEIWRTPVDLDPPYFSALKIVSLKAVKFLTQYALYCFLNECPSIENLSLEYCSFKRLDFNVSCKSIKYLEIKYCDVDDIQVDQAFNLEFFSFVSQQNRDCETMVLNNAFNLKRINVCIDNNIGEFSLSGCHRELEASIKCKKIRRFKLFHGYLSAKFSFELPRPKTSYEKTKSKRKFSFKVDRHDHKLPKVVEATILVKEQMEKQARVSTSDPIHVATLVSFIQSFSCCKSVNIYGEDFQVLIVPKPCRTGTSSPLLPNSTLKVKIPKGQAPVEGRDEFDELWGALKILKGFRHHHTTLKKIVEKKR